MTYIWNVYYESIKREPNIKSIYECRCDERLQTKTKKFTRLPYTGPSQKEKQIKFFFLSEGLEQAMMLTRTRGAEQQQVRGLAVMLDFPTDS